MMKGIEHTENVETAERFNEYFIMYIIRTMWEFQLIDLIFVQYL